MRLAERNCERWRIGYVGLLRCQRSLITLCDCVRRHNNLELHLHGVPDPNFFPSFDAFIAGHSRVKYFGRFNYPGDLAAIYRNVDFAWLPDFSATGGNSEWLLPNRLYEACAFGAVPISVEGTETARWLTRHEIGILLKPDVATALDDVVTRMTVARLNLLKTAIRALPHGLFEASADDVRELVAWLRNDNAHN